MTDNTGTEITRVQVVGKQVDGIFATAPTIGEDGFRYQRCIVQIGNLSLELDQTGIYSFEPLRQRACDLTDWLRVFPEMDGCMVTQIVVSECLPTLAVIIDNKYLLHCADGGPPFKSFGPQIAELGDFYDFEDFVDFWTRNRIAEL